MNGLTWLGVVLLVLWAVLWLGVKVVGGLVHILVIAGVALLIWGLVRRGAGAVREKL